MTDDITGPVGSVDLPVLQQIRTLLIEEEPLIESTRFDDPINPTELIVDLTLSDRSHSRLEVTWWQTGAYRFHYTESDGIDFRYDNHPKSSVPDAHFHPPPNAGPAEPSFLQSATRPLVITRAIVTRIREAIVDGNGLDRLNE